MHISQQKAVVNYQLDLGNRKDQSLITWYRCTDKKGGNAIPIAVSRLNEPEYEYHLTSGDIGYYLMAKVEPKHLRSLPGAAKTIVSKSPIKKSQVNINKVLETNFQNFACSNQFEIKPGFWTIDGYKPIDTHEFNWTFNKEKDFWIYGNGFNGAVGTGLLQDQKGARLLYTPVGNRYEDMNITLTVDPTKLGGQGFGSPTCQYMDVCTKFDTKTLTGYALRIIRTTKYSDAVDFILMKYTNGKTEAITAPVSANCYRTGCTITLNVSGNKLTAHVESKTKLPIHWDDRVKQKVDLQADITPNHFGGFVIQHTGSTGESTTMLHHLKIEWK